ncbi:hypothetical protein [Conyzicola sp.]|uniref:hypothetical protein n=1 Tax=Conyzicola sp. TaxID=1969404 RepID=UPI003989B4B0
MADDERQTHMDERTYSPNTADQSTAQVATAAIAATLMRANLNRIHGTTISNVAVTPAAIPMKTIDAAGLDAIPNPAPLHPLIPHLLTAAARKNVASTISAIGTIQRRWIGCDFIGVFIAARYSRFLRRSSTRS